MVQILNDYTSIYDRFIVHGKDSEDDTYNVVNQSFVLLRLKSSFSLSTYVVKIYTERCLP
jgi:hypothetical protein